MYDQYKPRHPLAWGIIAGIALFSAVAIGAMQGWLPVGDNLIGPKACAECAVVESIKTIEIPAAALAAEPAATETPAVAETPAIAETPAVPPEDAAAPEQVAAVAYSYETTVRFEDGTTGVFSQVDPPTWQAGDKVRVVDGEILVQG